MPDPSAPRILLADDDELIRTVYASVLRAAGWEVAEARDGAECASVADVLRPDLVLLDLNMPGTSGWEALRLLRARPETAGLLVAALTGDDGHATRRDALEAGFDAHVVKPFTPAALVRQVDAVLAAGRVRARGGGAAAVSAAAAAAEVVGLLAM